jgi:hypothetical protein
MLFLIAVLAGAANTTALAGQSPLTSAKSLRCTFPQGVAATWDARGASQTKARSKPLVLRFETIDSDTGTAQLRNGSMTSEVTVRAVSGYLHLMQSFRTGPLYVTTVFEAGSNGSRFKAVHSRHEYFSVPLPDATSSPEQYYGECEAG